MEVVKSSSKEQWKVVCVLKSFVFPFFGSYFSVDFEISVIGKAH